MLRFCTLAVVALIVGGSLPQGVEAGPIYNLDHFQDTYNSTVHAPGGNVGPQSSPIDYDFEYQSVHFLDHNYSEVHANIGAGSIGITASAFNDGVYAPQRQEVYGSFTFDVFFASVANDPISVVLNLELAGQIVVGTGSYGTVVTSVSTAGGPTYSGTYYRGKDYNEVTTIDSNGMLSGFTDDGAAHSVSTGVFNVAVNQNVTFSMTLGTIQGYQITNPTIDFGDTFNLSTSGDVFTILGPNAGDITVNSVDAGIVDNRYGVATAVPEPSSLVLLGAALGLWGSMFVFRRRSPSKQALSI